MGRSRREVSRPTAVLMGNKGGLTQYSSLSLSGFPETGKNNSYNLCAVHLSNHQPNPSTYVLKCSAKIKLVEVPVIVVSPPMVEE